MGESGVCGSWSLPPSIALLARTQGCIALRCSGYSAACLRAIALASCRDLRRAESSAWSASRASASLPDSDSTPSLSDDDIADEI